MTDKEITDDVRRINGCLRQVRNEHNERLKRLDAELDRVRLMCKHRWKVASFDGAVKCGVCDFWTHYEDMTDEERQNIGR